MRETVGSLGGYFMLVGVATIVAALRQPFARLSFGRELFVLACALLAVLMFVAGVRLSVWLQTRLRLVYAVVIAELVLQLLSAALDALGNGLLAQLRVLLWIRCGFVLSLGAYLMWNVRRLSRGTPPVARAAAGPPSPP